MTKLEDQSFKLVAFSAPSIGVKFKFLCLYVLKTDTLTILYVMSIPWSQTGVIERPAKPGASAGKLFLFCEFPQKIRGEAIALHCL